MCTLWLKVSYYNDDNRDIVTLMGKLSGLSLPPEVMVLLIPVVSLSADGLSLERKKFVEDSQVEYLSLIYRYLITNI